MYQGPGVGHSVVTRDQNKVNFSTAAINLIHNPNATVTDNTQQYIGSKVESTVVTLDRNANVSIDHNVNTQLGHTVKTFMETAQAQAELARQLKSTNVDSALLDSLREPRNYSQLPANVKEEVIAIENQETTDDEADDD